jgi:hypothetical protein
LSLGSCCIVRVFGASIPPPTVNPAAQPPIAAVADDDVVDEEERESAEITEHEADMIFLNRFSIAPADAALMVVPASRTSPRVIDSGSWWMADGCGCAMIVNGTSSSFFLFGSYFVTTISMSQQGVRWCYERRLQRATLLYFTITNIGNIECGWSPPATPLHLTVSFSLFLFVLLRGTELIK